VIKLISLIKEGSDDVIEKFISLLSNYDLNYISPEQESAFKWNGSIYPTITDKDNIVKVALDRSNIFGHDGRVFIGSHPMLNGYVIQAIVTDPNHRGQGKAREILKKILLAANESGLTLKLEPVPMKDFIKKGDKKLSQTQLQKWYSKYGFEKEKDVNIMTRMPKKD
jgi:predicted GNAT family N-acyltransferase